MDNENCRSKTRDAFWREAGAVMLVFFLILYLSLALIRWQTKGYERSSFVLPVISLLDHGSFRIDEDDLETACAIFPEDSEYYRAQYAEHLPMAKNGDRYPYYLGIFSPLCIPAFCAFRLLGINPGYAFPLTNALLAVLALWVVYRFAKLSEAKKLLAILLLGFSPIILYLGWWEYEMAMYAFVVAAMVFWFNKWRKLAALFLSLAGTMNPTVMAFGLFMILDYFLDMLAESGWSVKAFFRCFAAEWKKTAGLVASFLPCLVPFVINYIGMGSWYAQSGNATLQGLGGRFLAFLFDLNLGFFPYFPVLMFLFAAVTVWGGVHGKRYDMLCTLFGSLATVAAYSLHFHINSGMAGIARYNACFFPVIILGAIYYTDAAFSGVKVRRLCSGLTALSCLWCVFVVGITAYSPYRGAAAWWTPVAETVMEYMPGLYNPLPSTFRSRTEHVDGGYDITGPIAYLNSDYYVRKVLVPPGMLNEAIQQLAVPTEERVTFEKQCAKVKRTDKYYYLDFPSGTHIRKSNPYELGTVVSFDGTEQDAHKYFLHGISFTENNISAWTDGNTAELYLTLGTIPQEDLRLNLYVAGVYQAPQRMTVRIGENVLFNKDITDVSAPVSIDIPVAHVENGIVDLTFDFPGAVSPLEMGESVDARGLAFSLNSFSVSYASENGDS